MSKKTAPIGAKYIFEENNKLEVFLCGRDESEQYLSEWMKIEQESLVSAFKIFRDKKHILSSPLWEVDSLLDSDEQWEFFLL